MKKDNPKGYIFPKEAEEEIKELENFVKEYIGGKMGRRIFYVKKGYCKECKFKTKELYVLTESRASLTDAELCKEYLGKNGYSFCECEDNIYHMYLGNSFKTWYYRQ